MPLKIEMYLQEEEIISIYENYENKCNIIKPFLHISLKFFVSILLRATDRNFDAHTYVVFFKMNQQLEETCIRKVEQIKKFQEDQVYVMVV